MSVLAIDYTNTQVLIYDLEGNHLHDTMIVWHNKVEKQIQVAVMPPGFKANDECKLFIMTSPAPCEYMGKVKKVGGMFTFALFQGHVKEDRAATRYKVNTPATISTYFSDGKSFDLLKPISVTLINISTSGVRFRAPFYTLNDGDRFRINMTISGANKSLIAESLNHLDDEPAHSDYGCRFV